MLDSKKLVGGALLWWYLSFACSTFSQLLLRNADFSSLLLTVLQSLAGCIGVWLFGGVSLVKLLRQEERSSLSLTIGMGHFVGSVCTNVGLSLTDESAVRAANVVELIATALLCARLSIEPISRPLLIATVMMSTGVALISSSDTSSSDSWLGFGVTLCSAIGFAVRNTCIKLVEKHSAAESFVLMSLMSFVISIVLWLMGLVAGLGSARVGLVGSEVGVVVYASVFHFFYTSLSLFVLQHFGLMNHAIGNALKQIVTALAVVMFFDRGSLAAAQCVGVLLCIWLMRRGLCVSCRAVNDVPGTARRLLQVKKYFGFVLLVLLVSVVLFVVSASLSRPPDGSSTARPKREQGNTSDEAPAGERELLRILKIKNETMTHIITEMEELKQMGPLTGATAALPLLSPRMRQFVHQYCGKASLARLKNSSQNDIKRNSILALDAQRERILMEAKKIEERKLLVVAQFERTTYAPFDRAPAIKIGAEVASLNSQNILRRRHLRDALAIKILFFTGAANHNIGDDEMPSAWLAHIAASSLNWIPYFALQQGRHRLIDSNMTMVHRRKMRDLPRTLAARGFNTSYFLSPVVVVHRHDTPQLLHFGDFDAMIVGGGGMIATGGYSDFISNSMILAEAHRFSRPIFIAGTGSFYPANTLYSNLLQQCKLISVRDTESWTSMEQYANFSGAYSSVMSRTSLTADLIAAAPQSFFSFPSLDFRPLPEPVPEELSRIVEQLERDNIIGTGNVSVPMSWRARFPICWILKKGHRDFVKASLALSFSPVDFIIMVNPSTARVARELAPDRQIYLFNQNATEFSQFLVRRCRMVVSMALHGAIYAVRLGIPTFGFLAGKIEGALRNFGGEAMVEACSTGNVPPSLAAIVRCHQHYNKTKSLLHIGVLQDRFTEFLRNVDRMTLTTEDLVNRRSQLDEALTNLG